MVGEYVAVYNFGPHCLFPVGSKRRPYIAIARTIRILEIGYLIPPVTSSLGNPYIQPDAALHQASLPRVGHPIVAMIGFFNAYDQPLSRRMPGDHRFVPVEPWASLGDVATDALQTP